MVRHIHAKRRAADTEERENELERPLTSLRAMHDHRRVLPSKLIRVDEVALAQFPEIAINFSDSVPVVLSCRLT